MKHDGVEPAVQSRLSGAIFGRITAGHHIGTQTKAGNADVRWSRSMPADSPPGRWPFRSRSSRS